MDQAQSFHPASRLLDRCEPSLPAATYYDPGIFEQEQKLIFARNWVYAGRSNDLPPMTLRRVPVAGQNVILLKDQEGAISCFHNTCRHRGSELCSGSERQLKSRLITCPYHQWGYSFSGTLVSTPNVVLTPDFRKEEHGLFPVHVREWNGFMFVCLADEAPDFAKVPDLGAAIYGNWPMAELVTGHTSISVLECNWKIFWENFNECLHCPGIHPELCDLVPVYNHGIMAFDEKADWTPETSDPPQNLKQGARSWTQNGQTCGPEFPRLTKAERDAGYLFVTLLPTMFAVTHSDYVRAVSVRPLSAERTEIRAEWLFSRSTLEAPGFDLANVTGFASKVMQEDRAACEMNQRGLRSSKFRHGTLAPQEYAVFQFQEWVRHHMEETRS